MSKLQAPASSRRVEGTNTPARMPALPAAPANQDLTYVYDALGNRIRTIENGVTTEYTANNLNQYVQRSEGGGQRSEYVFDLDGNLIAEITTNGGQRTTNTFVYGDENRLIAVSQGADTWEYTYDALGNRVATTENGATKRFVIDPIGLGNVVGEYDATGNLFAHYDHGLGLLSRTDGTGAQAYYTFDAIGNVQQLVTAAGAIANAYAYAPFGVVLGRSETLPNPFQYVGQLGVMKDQNGLIFMRARYYEPPIGQFTSQDPLDLDAGDLNYYRYAAAAPTILIDPSGEACSFFHEIGGKAKIIPRLRIGTHLRNLGKLLHFHLRRSGTHIIVDPRYYMAAVPSWLVFTGAFTTFVLWPTTLNCSGDEIPFEPDPYAPLSGGTWNPLWRPPSSPAPPTQPGGSGNNASSGSGDPNAKTGPSGFGTNGFITASGTLAYRVDFENETNATAPAQQVVITDQLNGNLDLSTFRLAEVGFGDQLIVVPPNSQHFETNVPVSYLGTNFEVQIEAGINLANGQLTAVFRSIDPNTGLPPPVNIGFLPPEPPHNPNGTPPVPWQGRGQGYISYTIKPKPNLPTGAQIRNVAQISFDLLPSIATNQRDPHNPAAGSDPAKECLNTIDAGPPASHVSPLDAVTTTTPFLVSWTGQDDANGSGVAGYDIYVSDDDGPWTLWQAGVTSTQAPFTGQSGHAYRFSSVARDAVGHAEDAPAQPDAQTRLVTNFAPVLAPIDDQTVEEESLVTFTALATDADVPAQTLAYSLDSGAPAGASIDPVKGTFSWTPGKGSGPNVYTIKVRVTDSGTPSLSEMQSFIVVVAAKGNPIRLMVPERQTIDELSTLTVTNLATGLVLPSDFFVYVLVAGPAGAAMDATAGVLTWTPSEA